MRHYSSTFRTFSTSVPNFMLLCNVLIVVFKLIKTAEALLRIINRCNLIIGANIKPYSSNQDLGCLLPICKISCFYHKNAQSFHISAVLLVLS